MPPSRARVANAEEGRVRALAHHQPGWARCAIYNTTYRRTGTLWDSRYQSSLIQAKTYEFTCMRCIELNPVRAAMLDDPAHYRWTSYRSNGLGQDYALLTPDPLYLDLEAIDKERQVADRA